MMTKKLYIVLACVAVAMSCTQIEEHNPEVEIVEKVDMTFSAVIESDSLDTKTVLDGELGDERRKVLWTPEDEIGLYAKGSQTNSLTKFVNQEIENTKKAKFDGEIEFSEEYYAIYPYSGSNILWYNESEATGTHYSILFDIPNIQKYQNGSFAPNTSPMVAKARYGETLNFQNLCGLLALRLTGEEKVSSITFSGKDATGNTMYVSGAFHVVMDYEGVPTIIPGPEGPTGQALMQSTYKSIKLVCDESVQLNESEPTTFYMVMPPATFQSFIVTITTEDGRVMLKEGTKPLTIKRSDVQPTAGLQYVETTNVDLSLDGTANCYIVTEPGYYSIDADVIGNGDFGIIKGANFHTDDSRITPASAELLWEDHSGSVLGVTYENGVIKFMTTGVEGNAVIAAKDADGTILWSWHIWCTDQPQVQTYMNSTGNYDVLDRNLGATRADRGEGEQWKEAVGLVYQWGRKDPFNQQFVGYTTHYDRASVEDAIMNPNIYYGRDYSSWLNCDMNPNYWTPSQKTIYDPCPAGYLVAYNDVWRSFTTSEINEVYNPAALNVSGNFDHGWDWKYDGVNTTYYPINFYINAYNASFNENQYGCELWQSVNYDSNQAYVFQYNAQPDDTYIFFVRDGWDRRSDMSNGRMVRCVRDGQTKNVSMSISPEEEVTATSVKVRGRVSVYGKTLQVTERGFVYGTDQNVTQANGQGVVCGEGIGEFDACIEGLTPLTKYYVRAYAATTDGLTHYSSAIDFITPGDGGVVNLSIGGSANCYIVDPVKAKYEIDLVKGNSQTSVGNATDAIILWETYNTNDAVSSGTVVESAKIENGKLVIEIPENVHPGNAIVAVRNSSGTILWSWHIWVADYDPEATVQTYVSGAVLMDRNLGAISATPGTIESYGLYYQWGRKDPFIINYHMVTAPENAISYEYRDSNNDNIEQAVKNPCVVYNDANWGYNKLWDSNKTIYDPCPAGWRVMDSYAWSDVERASSYVNGYFRVSSEYATPNGASIPTAGRTDGDEYVNSCYEYGYYFTTNPDLQYYFHYSSHKMSTINYGEDNLMSVRCQKIDQSDKPGNGDDYIIDDEYEWE